MADDGKDRSRAATEDEDPFLARWARRKQAARRPDPEPPADEPAAGSAAAPPSDEVAEQAVDEESLPPPETLGPDSDFSAYLSRRVSSGLRRAALRQLFSLPDFNVRDGLDDYDEDYTSFAPLGNTVTADMRHHEERRRARDAQAQQDAGAEGAPARDETERASAGTVAARDDTVDEPADDAPEDEAARHEGPDEPEDDADEHA